jgi:hypothetical protein
MARQIAAALAQLQETPSHEATDVERRLQGLLKNMDDKHFVVLTGSYNIWQEVSELVQLSDS